MKIFFTLLFYLISSPSIASSAAGDALTPLNLTHTFYAWLALALFVGAYFLVIIEDHIHMRKSKPVMVAAGVIWILVAIAYRSTDQSEKVNLFLEHNLLEYVQLMLFLLAAMTYINTMDERRLFDALRGWLVTRGFSLYAIFWITGILAFFISPVADNLTTALLMAAVVIAVAGGKKTILSDSSKMAFVSIACVNIVVAANAGGAFSPFGDITTLMVWQKGKVPFGDFLVLFVPSVVNWVIPAIIMSFFVSKAKPDGIDKTITVKKGGYVVVALFIGTIILTVTLHNTLHLPPALGMMTGLGVLKIYGFFLRQLELHTWDSEALSIEGIPQQIDRGNAKPFDIFTSVRRAEWDTLMFFYGVILCVGGLGALGYLALVAELMYIDLGPTWANILVGLLSAIVDNIPVMFAVLTMEPHMSLGQWLLVTLTAGVGGSLLSVGSAAGVALMGQARGIYTFFSHLKWSWAVALGYIASIWTHMLINSSLM
jgi:Na+/H+ antiporter NhaD/arsenite permease-like protein